MRTARWPKPEKRGPKATRYIRRGTPPRARVPARHGDARARYNYGLKLWSKIIRARMPSGICARCRLRPFVDAAHGFIKGRYRALALDLDNGLPLCRACHRLIDSDHLAKETLFRSWIGSAYDRLLLRAQARSKTDLDLALLSLEVEARRLEVMA